MHMYMYANPGSLPPTQVPSPLPGFRCATTGGVTRVEYTFGYKKNADGKVCDSCCTALVGAVPMPYQAA